MMDLVSLPMYDFLEVRGATDLWYEAIRAGCARRGLLLPTRLERDMVLDDSALHSRTALTQTCGYPLVAHQRGKLRVVGTPVYACAGCEGPRYSSCIVVRAEDPARSIEDLRGAAIAKNNIGSMSGDLLFTAALGEVALSCTEVFTGAHTESLRAVREGHAAAAAIDCVTFALLARCRPEAVVGVRVLQHTLPALALPYCASAQASDEHIAALRAALQEAIADPALDEVRAQLLLRDFVCGSESTSEDAYLACVSALKAGVRRMALEHVPPPVFPAVDEASVRLDFPVMALFAKYAHSHAARAAEASWDTLDDGRYIRQVLPHRRAGQAAIGGADTDERPFVTNVPVCTVFFMGRRLRCHETLEDDLEISAKCWEADAELVSTLDPALVRCYVSGQRASGGDWVNMVALRAESFEAPIEELNGRPWHCVAVSRVAPHYYRYVRLHRAILTLQENNHLRVEMVRTLALHYANGQLESRTETKWQGLAYDIDLT
jgi:hypothetical protein